MAKRIPLIVVLGASACGKSKLAIEIARKFGGEIISADSMQLYKNLDIVTNKVSLEEQALAKHHMIDILQPTQRYSVVDFRDKCLDIITNIFEQSKLPIVVGGTNYYIEALLWKSFLVKDQNNDAHDNGATFFDSESAILKTLDASQIHNDDDLKDVDRFFSKTIYADGFAHIKSEQLWKILEIVDPDSAHYYHPNDKRRIIRCLQVYQRHGRDFTEIVNDQNIIDADKQLSSLGGTLRYDDTCVLWIDCDTKVLEQVIDERLNDMWNRGLLSELEAFHDEYNKRRTKDDQQPDYTKGIYQTIGFKEFHNYLMMDSDQRQSETGKKELYKSIRSMRQSTKNYVKRQLRWIRRRFLNGNLRDLPPVYRLKASFDETGWIESVREPAFKIVDSHLRGASREVMDMREDPIDVGEKMRPGKLYCEVCDKLLIGSRQLEAHMNSRSHRRRASHASRGDDCVRPDSVAT